MRLLGWPEVPLTVVDLSTAAEVLRAEADENTCRKPLTPYEASKARERRSAVLAPLAEEAVRATQAKPGERVGDSNLEKPRPKVGDVRKAAAIGTGYSGTTLDKVDKIRSIAERGVTCTEGWTFKTKVQPSARLASFENLAHVPISTVRRGRHRPPSPAASGRLET